MVLFGFKTIWNFSSHDLTDDEHETLKYGLRHGIAMQPDENEILASAEAVWNQIATKNLCKDGMSYQRRAKKPSPCYGFQPDQY